MKSSEHLIGITEEVMNLIDSRDAGAGLDWMDTDVEPLDFFIQNIFRKAFVLKTIYERDGAHKSRDVIADVNKDLIGYAYLFQWRIEHL